VVVLERPYISGEIKTRHFVRTLPLSMFKCEHNAEALLDAMAEISHVVDIHRPSAVADKAKLQ